ncbi:ACP S-malonyltransferase [Trichlorobacter lovleyi]|uniref:ACP S-malonyltransferase n=1 Tax=Trichlorobacter lovleyi TaxID=313985 RepID=UPI00223FB9E6|nr:ACP S-malonyltransferase [Trichlorobacter lovleyi]QOX79248.1 ACP S-malonyltransferase [Trichlorobacter lovleyi]
MILWAFPGQPLQWEQGTPDDDDFRAIADLCREHCGYDLISHQPLAGCRLSQHTCLQIYGVAMSLYRTRRLHSEGSRPALIAEHSLGIYAALAAANSIGEQEALELVCRIGSSMARMSATATYALGCVIGLQAAPLEEAARSNGVFVANYNTSRHFLLAGPRQGIEAALAECRAQGAFSVSSFPCEAPLHTPLMAEVGADLAAIVAEYHFREPALPLLEHCSQTNLTAARIPAFLVDELQQPVYWEQTWKAARAAGVTRCIEVGSGQALSKFNRWIDSEAGTL